MKRAMICQNLCNNCQPCPVEQECEHSAIIRELPDDKPWIDSYSCIGCLRCAARCSHNAVRDIAQPCDGKAKIG
ncbi:MAG: 4Fe-4S binding protein [Armatimonadetes bacterium]|nr:4Fe-4S binding protein [Armatimonadota bacterium]